MSQPIRPMTFDPIQTSALIVDAGSSFSSGRSLRESFTARVLFQDQSTQYTDDRAEPIAFVCAAGLLISPIRLTTCASLGSSCRSAAATSSAIRTTSKVSDKAATGRSASAIRSAKSLSSMSRPCVEEFGNAFSRDRRRKPLTFNIIHRVVALDRVKASVRKRHKSADGDQSFDDQFVAIKRIGELA